MSLFIFETMTAANAAGLVPTQDRILFADLANTALNVTVSQGPGANQVTLTTVAGIARTFDAAALQDAGADGRISFDGSNAYLLSGSSDNDIVAFGAGVSATSSGVFHGLGGNDTITLNNQSGYIFGGSGNDRVIGGDGNDHLYGFGLTGDPSVDGSDSISGGAGSDYIQGNAGNDTLSGGDGSDRIQGGQGNDIIRGDDGNDVVNGNRGADNISGGDGNDILRGGQDDDLIAGDGGNDILSGDLGNDRITGGLGFDVLTGGGGNDVFVFGAVEARFSQSGATPYLSDRITDFKIGEDKIDFSNIVAGSDSDIRHAAAGVTYTDVAVAATAAQSLVDAAALVSPGANITSVVALQVGADTYLFYNDTAAAGEINSMIKLDAVVAADFTGASVAR